MMSTGAEETMLQDVLAQVKASARFVAKHRWHEWRAKLETQISNALTEESDAVRSDLINLAKMKEAVAAASAQVTQVQNDMRSERAQLAAQMLPTNSVDEIRVSMATYQKETDRIVQIKHDRAELKVSCHRIPFFPSFTPSINSHLFASSHSVLYTILERCNLIDCYHV